MKDTGENKGSMSGVFVFVLLGFFAVLATLMVLLGAQTYRNTTERTNVNSARRILTAYVRSALVADDRQDTVSVDTVDGMQVLTFREDYEDPDGEESIESKMIYCWDGHLMEQYTSDEYEFDPEIGEYICEAADMRAELNGSLLTVTLTGTDGTESEVCFALRSAQATR